MTRGVDRRSAGVALFGCLAAAGTARAGAASPTTRALELTFLRSRDPDPTALATFIALNWFAMDEIAKARGLITEYRLLASAETDLAWNLMVEVGYPVAEGYAGVAEAFDAIRRAHVAVPVDGKAALRDLGTIVETRRLRLI